MEAVQLDKRGFATPLTPISSQGMMRFGVDLQNKLAAFLNGTLAASRFLFTASTELTIAAGVLAAPTLHFHSVAAESGTSDVLDTIGAANNFAVVLKAKSGHSIGLSDGTGNINIPGGGILPLSGNRIALLYCTGGQWTVIGQNRPLINFTATRDPGNTDEAGAGYSVDSLWINTTLKRAWVCIDSTTGAALWKWISPPLNGFGARAANTVWTGVGAETPTVTAGITPTVKNTAEGIFVLYTGTADTTGRNVNTNANLVRPAYSPIVEYFIRTDSSLSGMRFWVGIFSGGAANIDTLLPIKGIAFRFTQGVDTGWTPILCDGSTQAVGTTIGTVAINTAYKLRIRVDNANSTVYFSVNDSVEQSMTSHYPASATDMGYGVSVDSSTGGSAPLLAVATVEVNW